MAGRCSRIALAGLCPTVLGLTAAGLGVRVNTSDSLPMGLYISTTDERADLIEFCPAGEFGKQAKERGYRALSLACPDGAAPILKPIVAREGDWVETTRDGIRINGALLPQTAPLRADGRARPLTPWPFGRYRVAPGTVWVASTYNRGSYDSRYMGPISTSQIRRRLRALWVLRG